MAAVEAQNGCTVTAIAKGAAIVPRLRLLAHRTTIAASVVATLVAVTLSPSVTPDARAATPGPRVSAEIWHYVIADPWRVWAHYYYIQCMTRNTHYFKANGLGYYVDYQCWVRL